MEDIKFTLIKILMDLCDDILINHKGVFTMYQYRMAEKISDVLDGAIIDDIQISSIIMATDLLTRREVFYG